MKHLKLLMSSKLLVFSYCSVDGLPEKLLIIQRYWWLNSSLHFDKYSNSSIDRTLVTWNYVTSFDQNARKHPHQICHWLFVFARLKPQNIFTTLRSLWNITLLVIFFYFKRWLDFSRTQSLCVNPNWAFYLKRIFGINVIFTKSTLLPLNYAVMWMVMLTKFW